MQVGAGDAAGGADLADDVAGGDRLIGLHVDARQVGEERNQAGAVVFPPEQKMGLIEAITRAGGFTRLADRKRIRLTRTQPDGEVKNVIINADDLIQGNSSEAWLLQKGDVDEAYYRKHLPSIDERLARAGTRLAALLNRSLNGR